MKKLFFIIIIFFVFPISIFAVSITDTSITGDDTVYTGSHAKMKFNINFSDIDKGSWDSLGLAAVLYELSFDENALSISNLITPNWDSKIYKDNDKYYVLSSIIENGENKCIDNILYCANYESTIDFYVKDTDTIKEVTIKIGDIEVGLLPMIDVEKGFSEDDVVTLKKTGNSKTIKIKRKGVIEWEDINYVPIEQSKPSITQKSVASSKSTKKTKAVVIKSKDNYIESLEIEGYNLNFRKYTNKYHLSVPSDVNSLKVNVNLSDQKAKYQISGADNLKKNDNEIKIKVTSETGEDNTYVIKVEKENKEDIPVIKEEKEEFHIDEKYLVIGGIILGGILFITLLVRLALRIHDRKYEKAIEKL